MQTIVNRMGLAEDEAIEAGMLTRSIESAQKKVEGRNFGIRKYVLQYDNVMNKQREIIYDERRKVLFGEDLRDYVMKMMEDLVSNTVEPIVLESKYPEEWDFETLNRNLRRIIKSYEGRTEYETDELAVMTGDSLKAEILDEFEKLYEEKEREIGEERMREVERMILLRVVDNLWMDQIDAMDQLKEGIGLRALGQQDPVAAYAQEGFEMFDSMINEIKEETVTYCYSVTVETETERHAVIEIGAESKADDVDSNLLAAMQGGMEEDAEIPEREFRQDTVRRNHPKIGRNDPCPCGSGKKYKNCCMNKDMEIERGNMDA